MRDTRMVNDHGTVIQVGGRYRTPFDPWGIVEVLALEGPRPFSAWRTAGVRFVGDHPHGYADGSEGLYHIEGPYALRPLETPGTGE